MPIAIGTKLGHYEIRSKIGEGGMGEVYQAQDTELDRTVALKILPGSVAANQQRMQRFIQEAKAASALNHPHILTIYEIGTVANSRFIATEFIEGETLRQRIKPGMKLSEALELSALSKGQVLLEQAKREALRKSTEYFNQAIEKDPNYALAYSGLSDAYGLLPSYGGGSTEEYFPRAKSAAMKAVELDDNLAEAHTSLNHHVE